MSFQFSPEVLIVQIDGEITRIEQQILTKQEVDLVTLNLRLDEFREDASQAVRIEQRDPINRKIADTLRAINGTKGKINSFQKQINNLIENKRLLELEVQAREQIAADNINLDAPAPILTPQLQPQIIIQKKPLPLKQLAIIGGAFLLLS